MLGRKPTKADRTKSAKPTNDHWWRLDLLEALFEIGGGMLHGLLKLMGYLVELVGIGMRIFIGLFDLW